MKTLPPNDIEGLRSLARDVCIPTVSDNLESVCDVNEYYPNQTQTYLLDIGRGYLPRCVANKTGFNSVNASAISSATGALISSGSELLDQGVLGTLYLGIYAVQPYGPPSPPKIIGRKPPPNRLPLVTRV